MQRDGAGWTHLGEREADSELNPLKRWFLRDVLSPIAGLMVPPIRPVAVRQAPEELAHKLKMGDLVGEGSLAPGADRVPIPAELWHGKVDLFRNRLTAKTGVYLSIRVWRKDQSDRPGQTVQRGLKQRPNKGKDERESAFVRAAQAAWAKVAIGPGLPVKKIINRVLDEVRTSETLFVKSLNECSDRTRRRYWETARKSLKSWGQN